MKLVIVILFLSTVAWSNADMTGRSEPTPSPDFECPNDETAYYNHPSDCSAYYLCTNGLAWYLQCPGGLYFNSQTNMCDWPQNVECTPGTTQDPSMKGITHIGPAPDYYCDPEVNGAFPHLERCEAFYDCYNGVAWLLECTDIQLFDLRYSGCEYAELVDCGNRTRPEGYPTQIPTTSTTVRPSPPFDCPSAFGQFPDLNNCAAYFVCSGWHSTYWPCNDNTLYNIEAEYCDHAFNVDCGDRPLPSP